MAKFVALEKLTCCERRGRQPQQRCDAHAQRGTQRRAPPSNATTDMRAVAASHCETREHNESFHGDDAGRAGTLSRIPRTGNSWQSEKPGFGVVRARQACATG